MVRITDILLAGQERRRAAAADGTSAAVLPAVEAPEAGMAEA